MTVITTSWKVGENSATKSSLSTSSIYDEYEAVTLGFRICVQMGLERHGIKVGGGGWQVVDGWWVGDSTSYRIMDIYCHLQTVDLCPTVHIYLCSWAKLLLFQPLCLCLVSACILSQPPPTTSRVVDPLRETLLPLFFLVLSPILTLLVRPFSLLRPLLIWHSFTVIPASINVCNGLNGQW